MVAERDEHVGLGVTKSGRVYRLYDDPDGRRRSLLIPTISLEELRQHPDDYTLEEVFVHSYAHGLRYGLSLGLEKRDRELGLLLWRTELQSLSEMDLTLVLDRSRTQIRKLLKAGLEEIAVQSPALNISYLIRRRRERFRRPPQGRPFGGD